LCPVAANQVPEQYSKHDSQERNHGKSSQGGMVSASKLQFRFQVKRRFRTVVYRCCCEPIARHARRHGDACVAWSAARAQAGLPQPVPVPGSGKGQEPRLRLDRHRRGSGPSPP
jgi:hypothetical protein